ncbi:hypothetical protein FKM82_031370 [Ascaphus truei]
MGEFWADLGRPVPFGPRINLKKKGRFAFGGIFIIIPTLRGFRGRSCTIQSADSAIRRRILKTATNGSRHPRIGFCKSVHASHPMAVFYESARTKTDQIRLLILHRETGFGAENARKSGKRV